MTVWPTRATHLIGSKTGRVAQLEATGMAAQWMTSVAWSWIMRVGSGHHGIVFLGAPCTYMARFDAPSPKGVRCAWIVSHQLVCGATALEPVRVDTGSNASVSRMRRRALNMSTNTSRVTTCEIMVVRYGASSGEVGMAGRGLLVMGRACSWLSYRQHIAVAQD